MIDNLLTQTCTITQRSPGARDAYNNPTEADSAATDEPCLLQQLTAEEIVTGSDRRITDKRLFLLPDVDIDSQSKVTVDGVEYEVHGDPDVVPTPAGPHHIEAIVRRIQG